MIKKPFVVLVAEDNEHDIVATRRAWKKYNIANPLCVVRDGEECGAVRTINLFWELVELPRCTDGLK
ncbi:MAG: hypothetical protein SWK90_02780 [Chloroflexota bacterium]|nr:hypothetical protein [Chloroflexota bacterium]